MVATTEFWKDIGLCDSIHKNEDEESSSERADTVDLIIYIREVSRYVEGKYTRGLKRRITRI